MKREWNHCIRRSFRVVFMLFILLFLFYIERIGWKFPNNKEKMVYCHFVGTYQETETSAPHKLTEKSYPNAEKMSQVILKGHFDQQIPKDKKLFMFVSMMKMQIFQNGCQIFDYGGDNSIPGIVKSAGIEWASFQSKGIEVHDQIEIRIQLVYKDNDALVYKLFLSNLCVGERYILLTEQVRKIILKLCISFFIMVLGMLFLAALQAFKIMKIPLPEGSVSCGLLMITASACTMIDYRYITLLLENGIFVMILDYVLQILIGYFLLYNLKGYLVSYKFRVAADCFIVIWSSIGVLYLILQAHGIADGPEMILYCIPVFVFMISAMVSFLLRDYRKHSDKRIKGLLCSCLILTVTAIIEVIHYLLTKSYWIVVLEAGLFVFTIGQTKTLLVYTKKNYERGKRAEELEKELMQSRITIMLSQIQPHFLYNTLTGIQELCLTAPHKAHQAISWFAQFLRGNMDSLSTTELIPFEKELQHVSNYLKLESLRFGSYLKVEYDLAVLDFKVPALCIQPIVENAVRYGISKKDKGGTAWIKTYEENGYVVIVVKDDGIGMKYDKRGNIIYQDKTRESHLGIENVRKRIKVQCKGILKIKSEEGIGTEVSIYIPRER